MTTWIASICLFVGCGLFTAKRLLRYLHVFQLEEYKGGRFLKWLWTHNSFDKRGTLISLLAAVTCNWTGNILIPSACAAVTLALYAWFEPDPRHLAKVSLKVTERAHRIYQTAAALIIFLELILLPIFAGNLPLLWASQIGVIQAIPLFLILACLCLQSDENRRQKAFVDEAKAILKQVNPYIIGITGSYGKTSTKEALGHILQVTLGPTFWTEKSINTVMGITRAIREHLKKGMRYGVIEMGAYGPGSINKLCALTPPRAAIITCIGVAHLERFGTEETILKAKSELAQNVPYDGILVCNGDNVGARRIAQENPKKHVYLYGFKKEFGHLDAWISDYKIAPKGTEFVLHWKGNMFPGFTPLLGQAALSNALAAFTMACALGADPEFVLGTIRNLKAVDNRLELRKEGDVTFLRDAYNSNPIGFKSALDVLADLPALRRIVMTPGMIELGHEQAEKNKELAQHAATICDSLIIVGETNRAALEEGWAKGGLDPRSIYWCATREEAFKHLSDFVKDGDSVLIENDLTDLYVAPKKF